MVPNTGPVQHMHNMPCTNTNFQDLVVECHSSARAHARGGAEQLHAPAAAGHTTRQALSRSLASVCGLHRPSYSCSPSVGWVGHVARMPASKSRLPHAVLFGQLHASGPSRPGRPPMSFKHALARGAVRGVWHLQVTQC